MFYDRKIKYLDYMENGDKVRSAGFVKIEVADKLCNIQLNINGLYPTDTFSREVWISNGSRETVLGEINLQAGRGQAQWKKLSADSLGKDKIPYEELTQIWIKLARNRELWCKWSDCGNRKLSEEEMMVSAGPIALDKADQNKDEFTETHTNNIEEDSERNSPNRNRENQTGWHYVQTGFYETVDRDDSAQKAETTNGSMVQDRECTCEEQVAINGQEVQKKEYNQIKSIELDRQAAQRKQSSQDSQTAWEEEPAPSSQIAGEEQPTQEGQVIRKRQTVEEGQSQGKDQEWRAAVVKEPEKYPEGSSDRVEKRFESPERPDGTLYVQWMASEEKNESEQEFVRPGQPEEEVAQKNPTIPEQLYEDKWKQLSFLYPHISPFHDERDYLSIGPGDFVVLQRGYHKLVNNSFLLHGYYNYEHLILARMTKRGEEHYYVGVPGNFYEREKQVAVMFGFESFECKKEPAKTGDFGYYMIRVEI